MLQVAPIKRDVIDLWPVAESGLPVRVTNSVTPTGVHTIGQLRSWSDQQLLTLRSFGRISLGHVRTFFRHCNQIEQGKQAFQNIREVFAIFLDDAEMKVLSARYGFDERELLASNDWKTLQEIGDLEHKTRERVRQIQETATAKLKSRLAAVCLQPFQEVFMRFINDHGKVIDGADLAPLQNDPLLGGCNVCGIVLLLSDLDPKRILFYHNLFSTLPESTIQTVESQAMAVLEKAARPVGIQEIVEAVPDNSDLPTPENKAHAVAWVMDHCPAAAATQDGRYFLYSSGTHAFLAEILKSLARPIHYRAVTNAFNDRVKPFSRKGAGFILDMLNANRQCTRVDRGVYDLKAD